jgi:transcriptional regulator with XRE-family HTH domain
METISEIRRNTITEALSFDDLSLGMTARIQRVCRKLTQQEMADMAGVCQNAVESFESNQCLNPIIKRKLLRAYDLIVEASNE